MDIKSVDKRRIRRRGPSHYISWVVFVLLLSGLAYTLTTNENYRWSVVAEYFTARSILNGIVITIMLTIVSMVLGVLLGLVIAVMRSSSLLPISALARLYITFFRGTPVLVQLIFWFNLAALYPKLSVGIPFTDISYPVNVNQLMGPLTAAIIGLSLNQAAYMAEIIRGGFLSVGKGQLEAAESLGMRTLTKLHRVIIPQALPSIIPATGNQAIGMLKETALVSVLGVADLLRSAQAIYSRTYETIPLLIVASLWYLVLTLIMGAGQSMIERRFSRSTQKLREVTGAAAGPVAATAQEDH